VEQGGAGIGGRAAAALRRNLEKQRLRAKFVWEGLQAKLRPLEPIPYPLVDVTQPDPVAAMVAATEFRQAGQWFAGTPSRALLSAASQALLYCLTRNLKPAAVFEIGTYMAGTSEAICRALLLNGGGVLHTTDPYGRARVPPILMKWPRALRAHIRFYPAHSMDFFSRMLETNIRPDLIFVDGRHDYEFAMFDLVTAARIIAPGGFIVYDNVSDPGPFFALQDFLQTNPGWRECGRPIAGISDTPPVDKTRVGVAETELAVLRAPFEFVVGKRPRSAGSERIDQRQVSGLALSLAGAPPRGTLRIQCALRGHGDTQEEAIATAMHAIDGAGEIRIAFDHPLAVDGNFYKITAETWLSFDGAEPLRLAAPPKVF